MFRKKLRSFYELLETGNNKKLIQEVDKLLLTQSVASVKKKQPPSIKVSIHSNEVGYDEEVSMTVAKALKCLALARSGRKQESDRLIDDLLDEYTTDENALNVIMQYCKETQQLTKIVSFYENATAKFEKDSGQLGTPEHEDILSSLFYAYVRNRDFSKQQQVSLKLYKLTNKMMFTFWNAASYVMMSKINPDEKLSPQQQQQRGLYLTLAEKILQKAYDENKMEYNGEFLLYLNILEEKCKFTEALKIIDAFDETLNQSKVGQINFKVIKKILYAKKMKNWSELRNLCEEYLKTNTNDWLVYIDYLDSLDNLNDKTVTFIDSVLDYLKSLKESSEIKVQGPYLAKIDFIKRIFTTTPELRDNLIDKLKNCLNEYLSIFCGKPGFYFDFIYFKDFIIEVNLIDLVLQVLKNEHDKNRPFKNIKSIYIGLSYWQIHRLFGKQENLNRDEMIQLAVEFESAYTEALEFGKDLLSTGFQYADEFAILATHLRYDAYKKFNDQSNNLVQLVSNLRHALTASPSNYQFKLLLLNIYSHLGAYESLQSQYTSMEIKNIQHFSTGNLLLMHNLRLGAYNQSQAAYNSMEHFFTSNMFDLANFLVNCYKYGTFMKGMEICSFMDTLSKSLTLNLCLNNFISMNFINHNVDANDEEAILTDLRLFQKKINDHLKEIKSISRIYDSNNGLLPDDPKLLSEMLLDHNDKNVVYEWHPTEIKQLATRQYETIIDEQRKLLKLRSALIFYIDSYLKILLPTVDNKPEEKINQSFESYKKNILEFDFNFNYGIESEDEFDNNLKINVTKSMYLKRWSDLKMDQVIKTFVQLTNDLIKGESFLEDELKNEQKHLTSYKTTLESIYESLKVNIEAMGIVFKETCGTPLQNISRILESFSASLESLSYVILIFAMCLSSNQIKPIWTEKVKKSKKKKGVYAQFASSVDLLFNIYELLCKMIELFSHEIKETICPNIAKFTQFYLNVQPTLKTLNQTPNYTNYLSDITQSYTKSFDELKNCFNLKLKYLMKFSGNQNLQLTKSVQNLKIN